MFDRRGFIVTSVAAIVSVCAPRKSTASDSRISVGLLCVTTDGGASKDRHFAINFTMKGSRWSVSEPGNTSDVTKTKSGNYVVVANVTSLLNDADKSVVAMLDNFNPDTVGDGTSGSGGKANETGRVFSWKVSIITK